MESPKKAEASKASQRKAPQNESEDELQPPSPIDIAREPDYEFPDAQELRRIESDTHNRLKAILEVAGVTGLSQIDARTFQDPEILRKLTNSVSTALDEAATALTRMKSEKQSYEAFLRGANQAPSPNQPELSSQTQSKGVQRQLTNTTPQQSSEPPQGYYSRPSTQAVSKTSASNGTKPTKKTEALTRAETPPLTIQPPTLQQQASDSMQSLQRLLTQGHTIQDATEDGESLLSLACSAGYYELAEVLLRMRASVEDRGVKGDSTPLMEAASGGYSDIVKLLIDHGANVNAKSSVGNTALTYACCGGYEEVVKILLNAGADVEHQNENGHTPLMEAASCGHVGVAKQLLDHGANINTHSNEFKESALTLACYKGHLEMVKFLLSAGADQEHKTDEMHTALMEASMDGHVDVARLLLDHGAQVNMPVDSFESPLTLAACGGHFELAALLLSRGADLEEVNDEGYTPLMEAAREGHEDVVQLLVEHGANVNSQTEETQETALTLACCGGFIEVAQYLIEHGADIELGASTPLMEAAQEGHVTIVRFLMEKGALINAETNTGDTALTYACANGHTHIADILLKYGAELEHESEGGRTPLMKAARAGHLQTVQFLVSKGGNVNRRTSNNDHTVLSLASAGGHISVVQYLLIKGATPAHLLRDNSTMLIEASRGGHANVANLLLRQPRYAPRKTETPEPSPETAQPLRAPEARERKQLRKNETRNSGNNQIVSEASLTEDSSKPLPRDSTTGTGVKRLKMTSSDSQQASASAPVLSTTHSPSTTLPVDQVTPGPSAFSQLTHLPSQVTHPPGPLTEATSSKDHPTAETIIEEYWKQRKSSDPGPSTKSGLDSAQSVFSTGNFSTLPMPSRGNEGDEPNALSSVNLTRFIPTLEALAGSLQDPNSVDSPWLASALATQLGEQALSNGIDGLADQIPVATSSDLASLLPSLGFDPSATESAGSNPQHPIYPSNYYHAMKQLSDRIQSLAASVGQESELNDKKESSALLDSNFPMSDIPPPDNFVPPDNCSGYEGSGYEESIDFENDVEITAYPSSEDELGNDEDPIDGEESDASYTVPDFNVLPPDSFDPAIDIEQETESNHDTALTLAAAGGHDELVELLLAHGANIEHRDKKGCTALILASSSGHAVTVAILLDHSANIEAQSDRTKDTALSLACSGGRQEVVELLLAKGANFEHRNVSDYTPLSLAASGGYVNIIKLLLRAGADINSRTGSKLGISPLMLASMNGHTSTVKLLLDMGSDINAQIETNRNTALTLACFQGRHEVVLLLVERQANVEHRAKTGLTPLMEAASGGYHEVGKVLIAKAADVNAAPVPSSKDTALTIAADKGHYKFVELILRHGALVDVKNKKGNSPLWLTCNGGHLDVVRLLVQYGADVDSQDNRKISSLMIAFKRGHLKVVKFLVEHVAQFPSDAELTRYIANIPDKDLLKKCQRCMEVIIDAKERQAAEANKNATSLLLEIDQEKKHEEDRKAAAARKRAKKKRQKEKKQALKAQKDVSDDKEPGNGDSPGESPGGLDDCLQDELHVSLPVNNDRLPSPQAHAPVVETPVAPQTKKPPSKQSTEPRTRKSDTKTSESNRRTSQEGSIEPEGRVLSSKVMKQSNPERPTVKSEVSRGVIRKRVVASRPTGSTPTSSPRKRGREEGWKEVGKRAKKVSVPVALFGQVIGKNSANLNAIKQATNTQIEVDKVSKQNAVNRSLTIRGSTDAVKLAHQCITSLSKDPTQDLAQVIRRVTGSQTSTQKRYLPPSDTAPTNDPHHELPMAAPATVATQTSVAAASIVSSTAKPTLRKSGSSQMIIPSPVMSVAGTGTNKRATTAVTAVTEAKLQANVDKPGVRASTTAAPNTVGFVRTQSSGNASQTASSGAVRKLFVAPNTQPSKTVQSQVKVSTANTGKLVRSNSKAGDTEQSKVSTSQPAQTGKQMSYSRVISSQESRSDIIEQPVQQILKTPTIFQEPATQLSKPRKISTYSDAVGKKHQGNASGETVRQSAGFSQPIAAASSAQGAKLNLAPGSKVTSGSNSDTSDKTDKMPAVGVWVDIHSTSSDKPTPDYSQQQPPIQEESKDKLSPPNSSLGPIGPPTKSTKSGSTTPALKNRSFSPAASKQRTSPAVISASPQRSELSPAAKSPLLGPAPPGLLPPPDKSYGNSFRPIQQLQGVSSDFSPQADNSQANNSNFQTLVPTPVRSQRPPLLATPPGLSMMQGTPVPSPEKSSPNKSPPHIAVKGFNPNAPTFVPMALQTNTRPAVPSTSSILGAPPTGKFPGFVPQPAVAGGSSILGQPQMPPMYAGSTTTQPRMVSPVPSIFPSQPPSVIQAPPTQPPPTAGQTSILGQPPPIFGAPIIPQGFTSQPPSGIFTTPQIEGGTQAASQPVPPHFGINIIPFQVNGQQQPSPNFIGNQPTQVLVSTPLNDGFSAQADSQQSVIVSGANADFPGFQGKGGEPIIDLKQISANSGLKVSGHQQILFSGATHSPTLPIAASAGGRSGENLFNLSLESFSALYPTTQPQPDASEHPPSGEGLYSKPSKGALPGEGLSMDGLAPIGTERAQKTSAAPPYAVLTPGILPSNVWRYSGTTAAEDSDWSKIPSGETQWPNLPGHDPSIQDSLESVLGRLGLLDYHSLLARNEIDLNALMLMNEQDFAEIGLPPGPRQALLLGIGRLTTRDRPSASENITIDESSPITGSVNSSQ